LRELLSITGVIYKPLSRPRDLTNPDEYIVVARECGGLGIANPTRIPIHVLDAIAKLSREIVVSAHVSETPWMQRVGGLEYLVEHGVRLRHIVHGIYLEDWEFRYLVDNDIVLVTCPRSNLWFQGRLPRLYKAYEYGVDIAIGSDNTGCFYPNVWSDIDIAYSLIHNHNPGVTPREFLRHIIRSSIKALGLDKPWCIREGSIVDLLAINAKEIMVDKSFDKIGAVIKRAQYAKRFLRVTLIKGELSLVINAPVDYVYLDTVEDLYYI